MFIYTLASHVLIAVSEPKVHPRQRILQPSRGRDPVAEGKIWIADSVRGRRVLSVLGRQWGRERVRELEFMV